MHRGQHAQNASLTCKGMLSKLLRINDGLTPLLNGSVKGRTSNDGLMLSGLTLCGLFMSDWFFGY